MSMRRVHHVYLADTARVSGDVRLGEEVSVWYGAVLRGDLAPIRVGPQTNIQDNAVLHCDQAVPLDIGSRVTIGHGAVVHGRAIGDDTLIGMGAIILGGACIGRGCLIAAHTVVPPGMQVPDLSVVMGVPGRICRLVTEQETSQHQAGVRRYIELAQLRADHPEDPRVRPWDLSS